MNSLIKEIGYSVLNAATLGRGVSREIGGETIRFPARWSRYYEAGYEPDTFEFFRRSVKDGDTVLDIGGHIGLFAVVAARLVGPRGKVYSFEPTPFTRNILEEVIKLNGLEETIEIRPEAVSVQSGETVFFDTGELISNANSLVRTDRSIAEIPVKMVSVDEFVHDRGIKVDAMKIDVEGVELDVLRGSSKTMLEHRPYVRLGLHPPFIVENGQSLDDIWSLIQTYRMKVVFGNSTVEKEWFCSQSALFDVDLRPE